MSNYNPNFKPEPQRNDTKDTTVSPPYSRESSYDNIHPSEAQDRGLSSPSNQDAGLKPGSLSVNPHQQPQAYTPYYAGASPTSPRPSNVGNPPSPKAGDKAYKAYRPPVQQVYSTDSVIPSQPHGPYTAYQPPKPVTSTNAPQSSIAPQKQPSPIISPLLHPADPHNNRPVSPLGPIDSLGHTSPPPGTAGQRPGTTSNYAPPVVSDSISSTPVGYEQGRPPSAHAVAPGPYTPGGGSYHQEPPRQGPAFQESQKQVPAYVPPKPAVPIAGGIGGLGLGQVTSPPQNLGYAPGGPGPTVQFPTSPGGAYAPFDSQGKAYTIPQPGGSLPGGLGLTGGYQDPGQQPPQNQQYGAPGAYAPPPVPGYVDPSYRDLYSPPLAAAQPNAPYQGVAPGPYGSPLQHQPSFPISEQKSYAVELPTSPGGPNGPPKPSKQLSFTLPPSDIYAERIANYMNMLEKEASLQPTGTPTLGQPEPEDLETRRNKVFRDWIISEAKLRGPRFATDLADDLDSLSFGSKRASGQFAASPKPRGSGPPGSFPFGPEGYGQPPQPKVTRVDVAPLLPLIYPPAPSQVSAASRIAPFQKTFTSASNLSFIEKNRASFVANQSHIDRQIEAEIDETRRRRGKRNPQDAENVVREIRKREGANAYERFDRDVVNNTYGELMKTGEVIETVKQGVEDFVHDSGQQLTTAELLEIFSFLTAVQDFSTTVHNHMESLLTERSMKYMYSLTVPLYEANDAAEAKKIEAWNQSVVAGQVADNKQSEEKRVGKYSKFILDACDQAIGREKQKSAQLTQILNDLVRQVDNGLRDNGRLEINIPQGEDIRPFDLSEEGKLLWLRSRILTAAVTIQASIDAQKTLQKTKDVAARLGIKARYAAQEADAVKQHPTNQQKNIEDINKLREQQAREIEELNRSEERDSESRGVERGRFEAVVKPAVDTLKARAVTTGGERANNWLKDSREEALLGWAQ